MLKVDAYDPRKPQRLDPGFVRGYTQALLDVQEIFKENAWDLKIHKKHMSEKYVQKLIKAIIDNRENVRERWEFIRYDTRKDDFENYIPEKEIDNNGKVRRM